MAGDPQQYLDAIGLIIGGNQPDIPNKPHFYSGYAVGDSTGVAGLHGCWTTILETVDDLPIAVYSGDVKIHSILNTQGAEDREYLFEILVLVSRQDPTSQSPNLLPYYTSVSTALRAHTQLSNLAGASPQPILDAFITEAHTASIRWGDTPYFGWRFVIRVRELLSTTYSQ